ncbi:MAG: hypothetical protein J5614_07275 [Paludibacteraceae bacterium]|nr:hypothetical protein [Paludibacteraceae bacterium]
MKTIKKEKISADCYTANDCSSSTLCNHGSFTLSQFIEKYKKTKVADGDWTERNVVTHLGRLTPLLDILGDVEVTAITRENMREFRGKLKRLPPHRTIKKEYKDKSIDQILAMNPVKTANDTLEAISSMFEWGIREDLIFKKSS